MTGKAHGVERPINLAEKQTSVTDGRKPGVGREK